MLAYIFELFFRILVAKVGEWSHVLLTVCWAVFDPSNRSQNIKVHLSFLQQTSNHQQLHTEYVHHT